LIARLTDNPDEPIPGERSQTEKNFLKIVEYIAQELCLKNDAQKCSN
jgi:hypothetical protein